MPYANLLHIYDADDSNMRKTAHVRNLRELGDVKELGISGGVKTLVSELDKLVKQKWTFPRVLFFTHGNAGRIFFGKQSISPHILTKEFSNRGYERLFPTPYTRMYFNGCNVAESEIGWYFLATAASIFLRTAGGVAFGHTSVGYFLVPEHLLLTSPLTFLMFGAKSMHFTGEERYVFVGPGGNVVKREEK